MQTHLDLDLVIRLGPNGLATRRCNAFGGHVQAPRTHASVVYHLSEKGRRIARTNQLAMRSMYYLPPTRLRAMNDFNASAAMEAVIAPR